MKLNNIALCFSSLSVIALGGCGILPQKAANHRGSIVKPGSDKGCIQGVVRDGLTGERVKLINKDEQGVFLLVRNKQLRATHIVKNPDDKKVNKNLVGEYYLCGFPLDESFPLLVVQDGYQTYEAKIQVVSTIAQRTPNSQQKDLSRPFPTLNADIELFPLGSETKDLRIVVYNKGQRIKGAKVQLQPTSLTSVTKDGSSPNRNGDVFEKTVPQIRQAPITVETDDDGEAIYGADQLALGVPYEVTVIARAEDQNFLTSHRTIFVGYRGTGANLGKEPYEVVINLTSGTPNSGTGTNSSATPAPRP